MSDLAMRLTDVSVRFKSYADRKGSMLDRLRHRASGAEVVAVDGVSFDVHRGEAFGVIGRNGAGKSTLMRCLAGTLIPDEGTVEVFGRTTSLLQLGVGFIPDLSGRRNVYLGGLAGGLSVSEIEAQFDDIVRYAGVEDAIDRPVSTYSSGMVSRLGFAVSMHLKPDIMLLDEVLAVGDGSFRAKSARSMKQLLEQAGTIVLVSHSLRNIVATCDRAVWLDRGRVMALGDPIDVVEQYQEAIDAEIDEDRGAPDDESDGPVRWAPGRKAQLVLEILGGGSLEELAAEHDLNPRAVALWVESFTNAGKSGLTADAIKRLRTIKRLEREENNRRASVNPNP